MDDFVDLALLQCRQSDASCGLDCAARSASKSWFFEQLLVHYLLAQDDGVSRTLAQPLHSVLGEPLDMYRRVSCQWAVPLLFAVFVIGWLAKSGPGAQASMLAYAVDFDPKLSDAPLAKPVKAMEREPNDSMRMLLASDAGTATEMGWSPPVVPAMASRSAEPKTWAAAAQSAPYPSRIGLGAASDRSNAAKSQGSACVSDHQLHVPGHPSVYCFSPVGQGRFSLRPVLVYLHGRGGSAESACRRWATIARQFGWLLCPRARFDHHGGKSWHNDWAQPRQAVMAALDALRAHYGRRVQLRGNTIMGFSEGALVAMNIGVREPRAFNRWLILGANTKYWGAAGMDALAKAKHTIRRVVLITGGHDEVVDATRMVADWLLASKIRTRLRTPDDLGHELALERMPRLYEQSLRWLQQG